MAHPPEHHRIKRTRQRMHSTVRMATPSETRKGGRAHLSGAKKKLIPRSQKMIPRSLDAIVGAAYHQSNSTQLNSNRYVLGQLTAPTRTSLTSDRARAVAVVRALGSPLSPLQGGPGCVPRWGACARGMAQARALRPARLLTHRLTTRATTLSVRTTDQGRSVVESGHGLGSTVMR